MTLARGSALPERWALGLLLAGSAGLLVLLARGTGPIDPAAGADPRAVPAAHAPVVELARVPADDRRAPLEARDAAAAGFVEAGLSFVSGTLPPSDGPESEKAAYRALRAEAAHDPQAFARAAPELLRGAAPECRKVACLRVLYDTRSPALASAFTQAITTPAGEGDGRGVPLPEFAVHFLGERAGEDAGARALLLEAAFGAARPAAPGLRARAAAHVARTATEPELRRLADLLVREEDGLLRASVTSALAENSDVTTVDLLFSDLGVRRVASALETD